MKAKAPQKSCLFCSAACHSAAKSCENCGLPFPPANHEMPLLSECDYLMILLAIEHSISGSNTTPEPEVPNPTREEFRSAIGSPARLKELESAAQLWDKYEASKGLTDAVAKFYSEKAKAARKRNK